VTSDELILSADNHLSNFQVTAKKHERYNAAGRAGISGILMDRTKQLVALPELDSGNGPPLENKATSAVRGQSQNCAVTVRAAARHQAHSVTVNVSCTDDAGDSAGCFGDAGLSTLVVRIWVP
jgi:hypothetical protein